MAAVLQEYRTETGRTLLELLDESPLVADFSSSFWVLVLPPDSGRRVQDPEYD